MFFYLVALVYLLARFWLSEGWSVVCVCAVHMVSVYMDANKLYVYIYMRLIRLLPFFPISFPFRSVFALSLSP